MTTLHILIGSATVLALACATDPQTEPEPRSGVEGTIDRHIAQIFEAHDADGSGALDEAEAEANAWLASHFDAADLDADGQVTPEEATALADDVHDAHCEAGDCTGHQSLKAHVERAFAEMDADGDRLVTAQEAHGHHLEHAFTQVDTDADGRVSATELGAFAEKMHAEPADHR